MIGANARIPGDGEAGDGECRGGGNGLERQVEARKERGHGLRFPDKSPIRTAIYTTKFTVSQDPYI